MVIVSCREGMISVSLCDVLYWFGIWSLPFALFFFFFLFLSYFFGPLIFYQNTFTPALLLWPFWKSSTVKRWINPPHFISSRSSVRFWRSASGPVVVVAPADRLAPKGLLWPSEESLRAGNPTSTSMSRQRLTTPCPTRPKSASTRSDSTLKSFALRFGVKPMEFFSSDVEIEWITWGHFNRRSQFADWNRERVDVAGQERPRQSLPVDISSAIPADGSARRSEHPGDGVWQEEPSPRLLPLVAQVQDFAHRGRWRPEHWETQRLDQCRRPPGLCPLQDCQIWKDQIPRHCPAWQHRDLRLGATPLSQIYGFQSMSSFVSIGGLNVDLVFFSHFLHEYFDSLLEIWRIVLS